MKIRNKLKGFTFALVVIFLAFNCSCSDSNKDIYSELKCCDCKKDFITCICPEAREMKSYINALLADGLNNDEVFLKVAQKYSLNVIIGEEKRNKIEKRLMQTKDPHSPELFIQPLSYNLGKISKTRDELKFVVDIQNRGRSPLTIYDLKTSCSCVTVTMRKKDSISPAFGVKGARSAWKDDLVSGEKAELLIVTDLNHPSVGLGHMFRTLEIKSNDPVHSLIELEFEVEVVE